LLEVKNTIKRKIAWVPLFATISRILVFTAVLKTPDKIIMTKSKTAASMPIARKSGLLPIDSALGSGLSE
jgi:hypothetical protein